MGAAAWPRRRSGGRGGRLRRGGGGASGGGAALGGTLEKKRSEAFRRLMSSFDLISISVLRSEIGRAHV